MSLIWNWESIPKSREPNQKHLLIYYNQLDIFGSLGYNIAKMCYSNLRICSLTPCSKINLNKKKRQSTDCRDSCAFHTQMLTKNGIFTHVYPKNYPVLQVNRPAPLSMWDTKKQILSLSIPKKTPSKKPYRSVLENYGSQLWAHTFPTHTAGL